MEQGQFTGISPIILALALVLFTIILFFLRRVLKSGKKCVLLTGLNETGKTLIYSQLLHNMHVSTYTSSQENIEEYKIDGKGVTVIDLPGYHSIRQQFFEKYKNQSKAIVYVIDSVTVSQNIRDAANVLYNILIDPAVMKNRPDLLILCNKQDQTLAKGSGVIKSMLEKELNTLRNTQTNQLTQLESKEKAAKLGDSSNDFSFNDLYCRVEFAESHAFNKNGSVDLEPLKKWIRKAAC
ncbi:signal recognition particle receptor subunit beta [Anthonomus grandis grandis]|uniref:signal recognition particle receptor subunit beta n=1 Tax=Anthonomus grandis grandis TaxID=2921223 RepID=UPI0021659AB9|nr:signal recognition particle receptor subunit beta [Anthonomus grandis grandis]